MCGTRCVLALVALHVGLAHCWDFAATKGDLLEFYTDGIKTDSVRIASQNLTALVYAEVHNMMLYVDKQSGNDSICGYDISSMERKCFTERNGRNIHGLAFDPVTDKLFFSDIQEGSINWISLKRGLANNTYGNLLIRTGNGIPTELAVDSCRGYIYWINTNLLPPTIERARFDGSGREIVITSESVSSSDNHQPHSLIIDQQTQRIYWMEPATRLRHYICYADLNGNNKKHLKTIFVNDLGISLSQSSNQLAVSKADVFWVDWCIGCERRRVWSFAKSYKDLKKHGEPRVIYLYTAGATVSFAANYKIEEKLPEIEDCDALKSLVRNDCDGPFCVHGIKVNGESICKCEPGYVGDRCDVSVCEQYCIQGTCSLNQEGDPKCRCNAGFSGNRCETVTV